MSRSQTLSDIDLFTNAYIASALWSSNDEDGEPLDAKYGPDDVGKETLRAMREDCEDFVKRYGNLIADSDPPRENGRWVAAGNDFWLNRNGHGAGFWDGDWEKHGDELDKASKSYGEFTLYVGDDGKVHGEPLTPRRHRTNEPHRLAAPSVDERDPRTGRFVPSHRQGHPRAGGPDPTSEWAVVQRMMKVYAEKEGLGAYVHNSALPIGHEGTWKFWAQRPGERAKEHQVTMQRLKSAYGRGGLSEGRAVRDYDVTNNRGQRIAGPFKDYGDARTEAERMGGVVGFVTGEGQGHAVGCPMRAAAPRRHNPASGRRGTVRHQASHGRYGLHAEANRRPPVVWNQTQQGNAHVSDGAEGFWASFPRGTSAQSVLKAFLATADYSAATGTFTVTAEIEGRMASARMGPGGEIVGERAGDGYRAEANRRRAGYPGSKRRPRNVPAPRRTPNQSDARQHGTVTVTSTVRPDLNGTWSFLVRPYAAGDGWEWIALQNGSEAKGGGARTKAEATKGGSEYIRHIQSIARGASKGWRTRRRGQAGPVTMEHGNGGSYRAEANRNSPRGGATRRISDRAPQMTKAAVLSIATQLADKVRGTTPKYVGAHRWSDRNESATFVTHSPEHAQPVVVLVSVFADGTLALDFFSSESRSGTDRYENIVHFLYSTVDYGEMKADITWVWETVDSYADSWGAGRDEVDERRGMTERRTNDDAVTVFFNGSKEQSSRTAMSIADVIEHTTGTKGRWRVSPFDKGWAMRYEWIDRGQYRSVEGAIYSKFGNAVRVTSTAMREGAAAVSEHRAREGRAARHGRGRSGRRHPHSVLSRHGAKRIAAEASGQRRRLREGPDAEDAGERYAEDQVNSDGFRDWVWDQMVEGRRMRKADPKSVIPLESAADYKKLARNMLQQLGWDIDRGMTMRDVLDTVGVDDQGSAANSEVARDFAKGVRNLLHKPSVVQWLATEARGFEKELKQAEKGRKAGEPAQTTRLLPPAPQHR
jgi:hypothetical protein